MSKIIVENTCIIIFGRLTLKEDFFNDFWSKYFQYAHMLNYQQNYNFQMIKC
jgi:hypothetical protein